MEDANSPASESVQITEESDIITARQRVRAIAQECGFDTFAASAIITITSELARNIWAYAGKGEVRIGTIQRGERSGIAIDFVDAGPGIRDLVRVLEGGFSQSGGLGLGLSGSKRLSDEFHIESSAERGTRISVLKWKQVS